MKFLMDNILLVGLAVGSGIMLLWPLIRRGGAREVTPAEAVLLINREHALILDVRNEAEFAGGHIAGAKNIPLAVLASRLAELQQYKEKPLLVNCQGGVRSTNACGVLKKAGFAQIHNLTGGMNAWNEARLPLVKGA